MAQDAKICGDRKIRGEIAAPIMSKNSGCGIVSPVRVTSVDDVALSTPALIDCTTAKALKAWVKKSAKPAFKRKGKLAQLQVVASYSCRTRNNKPGAKMSEHSLGHAIDIAGFTLKNGEHVSVLNDWGKGKYRKPLKRVHANACGIFGTVLGPNSDVYHRDHFHFDTARYRSGPYCR
ncbi:extensin family protein [Amylibacter kogurei]|uniref:Extensin family protein n=1 Tax=Paramylibacter kogurei TaxID=1889778 RepID=A0A2G5K9G0_9RHOB|nr:extensin family protein [Amylibacter kogurei]